MNCRACKYLDVAPDKSGRIVPRKGYSYRCLAPIPALPALPDSITNEYSFRWPPTRTHMTPERGAGCPIFEARK